MYYIQKGSQFLEQKIDCGNGECYSRLVEFKAINDGWSFIEAHESSLGGAMVLTVEQAFEELIR